MSKSNYDISVQVSTLIIGMYIARLDKDWQESSFSFQGFLIENKAQIKTLQKECDYIYVDINKSSATVQRQLKPKSTPKPTSFFNKLKNKIINTQTTHAYEKTNKLKDIIELRVSTKTITPPKRELSFDKEINNAKKVVSINRHLIQDFMSHVKKGGTIDLLVAEDGVQQCINSVLRSPDTVLLMSQLQSKHQSIWQHSMNVSVLAINLGRYLNLEEKELITLGLCGMLHDIGKLMISKDLISIAENKQDFINSHTVLGRDILQRCSGSLAKIVAEVAYTHHERLDGKGFPQRLTAEQISPYAKMIAIIALYDSLTIDTNKTKGLTHYEAISQILSKVETHFDRTLVDSFNQCIGTYPVGCIVEMNTGEVAMVVESHDEHRLRPKIILLTTVDKKPRPKKIINLAESNNILSEASHYTIRSIIRKDLYPINI